MFSSRLYQQSVFYSVAFIVYYWLFMMSQPSIIAAMPAVYYPKLLIVCVFFPLFFNTLLFLICRYLLPVRIRNYIFAIIPSGILSYFIYIFCDKLYYSKFAKNSLNLPGFYKIPFLFFLFIIFLLVYYRHIKGCGSVSWAKTQITKFFVFSIFLLFIFVFIYYFISREKYDLKVIKKANFKPLNILIVSIDGAEDDLMSVYGYKKDTTPFLRSIKNDFFIADNFYTNNCCTFGSLVSMYTGKLPLETKVIYPGSHLTGNSRFEHLPGIFKKVGYNTIQLTVPWFAESSLMGVLNGFVESNYRRSSFVYNYLREVLLSDFFYERAGLISQIYDSDLLPRLIFFIKGEKYVNPFNEVTQKNEQNLIDPFSDKNKIKYIINILSSVDKNVPFFIHVHLMETHITKLPAYEKGMIDSDENIKSLYFALKKDGVLDNTLFIVSSDHNLGWKTVKPIPLLIRFPHLEHAKEHFYKNSQIIDLAPTILDYIGINEPNFMRGQSILNHNFIEDRPIYSVNKIDNTDGFVLPTENNAGVTQIKVQICDEYLLEDLDGANKKFTTSIHKGYGIISACKNKHDISKYSLDVLYNNY